MGGFLSGLRVLDVSSFFSGPLCGYILAQLGADVIKIEEPEAGDPSRKLGMSPEMAKQLMGAAFMAANAGKRSVAINLKSPEGAAVFKKLVADSDVVLENFRPGVMQRLGLDYDSLRDVNPKLIYCAISGFGQSGPLRTFPAFDQIIQGMSGLMSITGSPETGPLRTGFPVSDSIAGITAALAIAAAANKQQREGKGAMIDVSMLDSALAIMGFPVSNYLIAGAEPKLMGNDNFTSAPSGTFAAKDGSLNIAINTEAQYQRLLTVLGNPAIAKDPRFATRESRKEHRKALTDVLEHSLRDKTVEEWVTLLAGEGVPVGPVFSMPQALAQRQVLDRELLQRFAGAMPDGGDLTVVRPGFRVLGEAIGVVSPPVTLGADTSNVLLAAGFSPTDIRSLKDAGAIGGPASN